MRIRTTFAVATALALCLGLVASSQAQRERPTAAGMVKSVDPAAKSFVITAGRGQRARDVTIKTDASTTFSKGGGPGAQAGTFDDVKTGKFVSVMGEGTPETGVTAKSVTVMDRAPGRGLVGTVKSVDTAGQSFVLTTRRRGQEQDVTVKWNAQTKVMTGQAAGAVSDIATGKRVRVMGEGSPEAGYTATEIRVLPPAAPGAGGAPGQ